MTRTELLTLGPALVVIAVAGGVHLLGFVRVRHSLVEGRPPREVLGQAALFWSGLAVIALVLLPPLGRWASDELFARSMIDVALAYFAAPLLVLGAPWRSLAAGAHWSRGRRPPGAADDALPDEGCLGRRGSARRLLTHPTAGLGALVLATAVWHLPVVLDTSAGSAPLWDLEMACYLAGGIALWMQILGSYPYVPAWAPLRRSWLVVGMIACNSFLGAAMVFSARIWYPAFPGAHRGLLLASLDQGLSGSMTWGIAAISLGAAAIWCYSEWLRQDEDEDVGLAQLIDRTRRRSTVPVIAPSRPGRGTWQ